jgi:2-dehydropantoate 2-reductase
MNELPVDSPIIAIVGAGSIGCYLGGCLISTGAAVTLIGRPRIQKQLSEYGLHLTDWCHRDTLISSKDINFSLSMSALVHADYIIVTVKSGDTKEVAQRIAEYAKQSAVIVSFQNGVGNGQILQQHLPQHITLKGMVPFNVLNKGGGHFHCGTGGDLAIEDKDGVAELLIKMFLSSQLPVQKYDNLSNIQWSKLIMNLNNAINALSGVPLLEQFSDASYRRILALLLKEALSVMKIAGIKPIQTGKVIPAMLPYILSLPTVIYKAIAGSMLKIDPSARSSMYEDLCLGRKTEIDYLNGEIVNLARQYHLEAPVNLAIIELVKQAEQDQNGSPNLTAKVMLEYILSK